MKIIRCKIKDDKMHLVTLEYVTSIPKKRAGLNLVSTENQAIRPAHHRASDFTELDLHNLGIQASLNVESARPKS